MADTLSTETLNTDTLNTDTFNRVTLLGRVSATPEVRALPSGDELVTFRLIVARPPERRRGAGERTTVDVIDIACWSARTRRSAGRLEPGAVVEVQGALRRRFFRTGGGAASRYEVEAVTLKGRQPRKGSRASGGSDARATNPE